MARPTKFNSTVAGVLERAVRLGLPVELAAGLAGVAASTAFAWLKDGRANRSPALANFAERITRARAQAVCSAMSVLWKAGDQDWRAAAKWLEMNHPAQYGPHRGISP